MGNGAKTPRPPSPSLLLDRVLDLRQCQGQRVGILWRASRGNRDALVGRKEPRTAIVLEVQDRTQPTVLRGDHQEPGAHRYADPTSSRPRALPSRHRYLHLAHLPSVLPTQRNAHPMGRPGHAVRWRLHASSRFPQEVRRKIATRDQTLSRCTGGSLGGWPQAFAKLAKYSAAAGSLGPVPTSIHLTKKPGWQIVVVDSISFHGNAIQGKHGLGKTVGNSFQDRKLALDGLGVEQAIGDLVVLAVAVLLRDEVHLAFTQFANPDLVATPSQFEKHDILQDPRNGIGVEASSGSTQAQVAGKVLFRAFEQSFATQIVAADAGDGEGRFQRSNVVLHRIHRSGRLLSAQEVTDTLRGRETAKVFHEEDIDVLEQANLPDLKAFHDIAQNHRVLDGVEVLHPRLLGKRDGMQARESAPARIMQKAIFQGIRQGSGVSFG